MLPSLFISHGSPMLALQPGASGIALSSLAERWPTPRAIVVVSAHWESAELLVMSAAQPQTWHDFGGFPTELYQLQYPAPGNPQLAQDILQLLQEAGLRARADERRPFDHGSWVPLSLMYPRADIPVVEVSLPSRHGAALQVQVGQALAALHEQNVLLIGSGSITHNLGEVDFGNEAEDGAPWAVEFRDWVVDKLLNDDLSALLDYRRQAPHARRNHPSEEHLLPLFFARGAGAACRIEHQGFTLGSLGMDIYSFS
ncbi:dioxygenase [Pseudomonas sp. CrR14]|nr:dioxygenase [Pseudomonas sp. CrR14]